MVVVKGSSLSARLLIVGGLLIFTVCALLPVAVDSAVTDKPSRRKSQAAVARNLLKYRPVKPGTRVVRKEKAARAIASYGILNPHLAPNNNECQGQLLFLQASGMT